MDTKLFSIEAFERTDSDLLAAQLRESVLRELEPVVAKAFARVIASLNAEGHKLVPYGVSGPGEFVYRDEQTPGECRLRLACDVVISAGYSDTVSIKE